MKEKSELASTTHASVACSSAGHAGLKESGVTFQRSQVVLVGAQADVAVGAKSEECASFNPQTGGRGGLEVTDLVSDIGIRAERYGSFKQGRIFYVFLQGGVDSRQCR